MLSKKMTVSLVSLITIFALVFTFMADDTFAAAKPFEIKIMGRTTATYATVTSAVTVDLIVESALAIPELSSTIATPNVTATVIDRRGFVDDATVTITDRAIADYPMRTAKKRQLRIAVTQEADTVDAAKGLIEKVIITIPAGLKTTDPTIQATDGTDTKLDESKLVQHTITLSMAADTSNLPKVVSIQRLRPGSQTVVAAFQEERIAPEPFNVRIVLTEHPHGIALDKTADENAKNLLEVENGTPSNLIVGQTFTRLGPDAAAAGVTNEERSQTIRPHPVEGMYWHDASAANGLGGVPRPTYADADTAAAANDLVPLPTGDDNMYRQYRVTITPHQKSANFDIKIKVKNFHDNGSPLRNTYVSPGFGESVHLPNGRDILTIPVKGAERNLTAGYKVTIPKDWIIPAGGYLIIAKNTDGSEIDVSGQKADRTNDTPRATHRTPRQLLYNVYQHADLPNLATEFLRGVVVDVESQHAGLVVSEVMWGEDASLSPFANSQWIELYNPGGQYKTIDDKDETPDVNEALTLIFYAPNEFKDVPPASADGSLPTGITDRIGTLYGTGSYWSGGLAGVGKSGRSGTGEAEAQVGRVAVETALEAKPIVSMYRVMVPDTSTGAAADAMMPAPGQMKSSWMSSEGPKSANFDSLAVGVRHGTPGAATDATVTPADTTAEEKAAADKKAAAEKAAADKLRNTGTIPTAGNIYISEIMFAGKGTLPQWIEIANGSATEDVNLSGWTLKIDNAAGEAVAGLDMVTSAKFTIPDGTMIYKARQINDPSTVLVVTGAGRYDLGKGEDQIINLQMDNEVELITAGVLSRRYILLSEDAFLITLAPPAPEKSTPPKGETAAAKAKRMADEKQKADMLKKATDMAGNLGADGMAAWKLPMNEEGARSSIIRKHINVSIGPSEPEDGMMMDNWTLASDTAMQKPQHLLGTQSFYGAENDVGTPGYRAGGALPVELSHFRPARDKATGQVVITWSTQSELNNAGFFVKRSNQRNGEFKVINATMIAGAGTTSEKQFYTYTDTTAQPNVVYYYQIEDVSLDGNRQTLTRGIRLKGHVGAAGKATTLWGELKTSHE